jgi:hypothetical protein
VVEATSLVVVKGWILLVWVLTGLGFVVGSRLKLEDPSMASLGLSLSFPAGCPPLALASRGDNPTVNILVMPESTSLQFLSANFASVMTSILALLHLGEFQGLLLLLLLLRGHSSVWFCCFCSVLSEEQAHPFKLPKFFNFKFQKNFNYFSENVFLIFVVGHCRYKVKIKR